MLELIFQGFIEWGYDLALETWQYFSSALLDIMSLDFAYLRTHAPVIDDIMQIILAAGWALLIGNLVFQAMKSMAAGLGFEGEDPKLLFARSFIFAFLLLASPQICEIGLSITSRIMDLLQVPDAVNVTFVDESIFGGLTASWLLVIVCGLIIMFKVLRLILEIAERYVILAMLTITAPLAFSMGGSRSTAEIFSGWCRMYGSMCLLMVTNVIFFKILLSVLSTVPSGIDVLPWMILIMTIVKVARKADAIVTRIGLNPAITGDSLGMRGPGALTVAVVRAATSSITKTVGKSMAGKERGKTKPGPTSRGLSGMKFGSATTSYAPGSSAVGGTSTNSARAHSQQNTVQQGAPQRAGGIHSAAWEQHAGTTVVSAAQVDQSSSVSQSTRQSAVPSGVRRSPGHVNTPSNGAAAVVGMRNERAFGAGTRTAVQMETASQNALSTRGDALNPGVTENVVPAPSGDRGAASVFATAGRVSSGTYEANGVAPRTGMAGKPVPPGSSRFTQVSAQNMQGGAVKSQVQAAERSTVSVNQSRPMTGSGDRTANHKGNTDNSTLSGKQGIPAQTRYTNREQISQMSKSPGRGALSGSPARPQHGMAGNGDISSRQKMAGKETRPGKNVAPSVTEPSAQRQHSGLAQQKGRKTSVSVAPSVNGPGGTVQRGPAGTVREVHDPAKLRQTARAPGPHIKSAPSRAAHVDSGRSSYASRGTADKPVGRKTASDSSVKKRRQDHG